MAVIKQLKGVIDEYKEVLDQYDDFIYQYKDEVKHLEDWLKKQPHLPKLSNEHLALFFTISYYSLEQAKENIDKYFTLKTRCRDFFQARVSDPLKVQKSLDIVEVCLPKTHMDGYRLSLVRLVDTDASKVDFVRDMKVFTAALEFELILDPFHKGLIAIFDASGFHIGYIPKINLAIANLALKCCQLVEGKIVQVHVINCIPVVSQVLMLIRPFLSPYLAKTLHFHTTAQMDDFHEKFVPKKYMPSNYGGELPSTFELNAAFRKRFQNVKDWFADFDSKELYVDETKRPKSPLSANAMIGSFRQLDID